jgi:hypothetical protein
LRVTSRGLGDVYKRQLALLLKVLVKHLVKTFMKTMLRLFMIPLSVFVSHNKFSTDYLLVNLMW